MCVLVDHKHPLLAIQLSLTYAPRRIPPFKGLDDVIAHRLERPGIQAFTRKQARELFRDFDNLTVGTSLTHHDLGNSGWGYSPSWFIGFNPERSGWFMIIQGNKPRKQGTSETVNSI